MFMRSRTLKALTTASRFSTSAAKLTTLSSLDPYTEEPDSNPKNSLSKFSTTSGYYGNNNLASCLIAKKNHVPGIQRKRDRIG